MNKRTYVILAATMLVGMAGSTVLGVYASEIRAPTSQPMYSLVGTGFTYQGSLEDLGTPANGSYDLQFMLYDDSSAGAQVGSTIVSDDVTVTEGLFTLELDFGDVFDGTAYWLEIWVRPGASAGGYQQLLPRQKITAAPYASNASRLDGIDSTGFALVQDVVPSGAVMTFNLTSCPSGWTEVVDAQGRAIVGLPSGGTLTGTVGTALTDRENRTHNHSVNPVSTGSTSSGSHNHTVNPNNTATTVAGDHNHTVNPPNTPTSDDSHNHAWSRITPNEDWWTYDVTGSAHWLTNTAGIPLGGGTFWPVGNGAHIFDEFFYTNNDSHTHDMNISSFSSSSFGGHSHSVDISSTSSSSNGSHSHSVDIPNTSSTTASTSDVMPYIQLLVCEKD